MSNQLALVLEFGRRFLRWWIGELASLVPLALRQRLAAKDALVVALTGEQAAVSHHVAGKVRDLGEVSLSAETGGIRQALSVDAALLQRFLRGRLPITLHLPAEAAVRTHLILPLAVESDLRQALLFQLDRRTPFSPDTVHFAYRVVGRNEPAKQIEVELTVVPRGVVTDAVTRGRALGAMPTEVAVIGASAGEPPSGNLLPDQERHRARPTALVLRLAVAATALAAVVALGRPIYEARHMAAELEVRVHAAKELADRTRRMKDELAKLTEAARFLSATKQQNPTTSELLYQLTHILPDDTWVQQVSIGASEIRISGFSSSSSTVIQLLGQSGVFLEPQFRAAVTQDPTTGKERFDIGAKIVRRPVSS